MFWNFGYESKIVLNAFAVKAFFCETSANIFNKKVFLVREIIHSYGFDRTTKKWNTIQFEWTVSKKSVFREKNHILSFFHSVATTPWKCTESVAKFACSSNKKQY